MVAARATEMPVRDIVAAAWRVGKKAEPLEACTAAAALSAAMMEESKEAVRKVTEEATVAKRGVAAGAAAVTKVAARVALWADTGVEVVMAVVS